MRERERERESMRERENERKRERNSKKGMVTQQSTIFCEKNTKTKRKKKKIYYLISARLPGDSVPVDFPIHPNLSHRNQSRPTYVTG